MKGWVNFGGCLYTSDHWMKSTTYNRMGLVKIVRRKYRAYETVQRRDIVPGGLTSSVLIKVDASAAIVALG